MTVNERSTAVSRFNALRSHAVDGQVQSRIERLELGDLSPGEVLIRTRHAGINYKDCLAILGQAKIIADFPRIAGIEAVGEVMASDAPDFRVGDAVLVHGFQTGIVFDGGFSEVLRVPRGHLQAVPEGLSPDEAAVLGVPAFTVAMALERFEQLGLGPDAGPVAVSGAGGAVGLFAIAILSKAGYRVAAITRRMERAGELRALGASEVIDAQVLGQPQRPLEKARFAAAIDNVGGAMLSWLLRSLNDGGLLASVGNAAGNGFDGSVLPFIMRRAQMFGIVANAPWPQRHRLWKRLAGELKPDFDALAPHVRTIGLHDLMAHARRQLDGVTAGRTLVAFEGG
jgi:putative YhdH/YhfP family quinone oxidoreductase